MNNDERRATPIPNYMQGHPIVVGKYAGKGYFSIDMSEGALGLSVPPGWWLGLLEGDYSVEFAMGFRANFMERGEEALEYADDHKLHPRMQLPVKVYQLRKGRLVCIESF